MFIPDIISEHNYRAVGSNNPEKSARVKANRLRNKIKALFQSKQIDADMFSYVDWKADVETCPQYQDTLDEIRTLYKMNIKFHTDIFEVTKRALESLVAGRGQHQIQSIDTEEGANYLVKELAFLLTLPEIYPEFSNYRFVYHADWPVLRKFVAGMYDGITRRYVDLFVLRKQK